MSLIVVRKDVPYVVIVSDTKLIYPDHETKRSKDNPGEGTIKTIILEGNLCISFAGVVVHAESAFKEIAPSTDRNNVIAILEKYHKKSNRETEFLVCAVLPEPLIHKIKDGESKSVHSSWIGDQA